MSRLPKLARDLIKAIEAEGATVLDTQQRTNHIFVSYTFDGYQSFTQTLPRHGSVNDRWVKNFRAAVRRNHPQRN